MFIRSLTWGAANLSWSVVMEEILRAAENLGHDVAFLSTNGYAGMRFWTQERALAKEAEIRSKMLSASARFDLDITYTVPQNFPQRFLPNSKVKAAIYNYESTVMPPHWKKFYGMVDYVLPSSKFVAQMFADNGCPESKIKVIPHGIDLADFNPHVAPYEGLKTNKSFKFLCVGEPHYRKQIDKLLDVYCRTFSSQDDVCLVLKTKIFDDVSIKTKKEFEMDLRPKLISLKKKYGDKIPEIKIVNTRLPNIASLYNACNAFVLMTASEGWGIPYLEALACGLPVVAPRHGGQLEFLNDQNALLCDCGTRKALPQEQYWSNGKLGGLVGNPNEEHFAELMLKVYRDYAQIVADKRPHMFETANRFTWEHATQMILDLV